MMTVKRFCCDITRQSGEPLAGSASFADRFVFITWPKRLWNYEALDSRGGFPPGLKQWMKQRSSEGNRITIRLASRAGISSDSVQMFFYPENRKITDVSPEDIPEVLEQHFAKGKHQADREQELNCDQVFVCTHGRHDQCCARFGQEVYQRLRDIVSQQNTRLEVWESSHLGGHRFAANLIVFPCGELHGQLLPEHVSEFLRCRQQGRVYGPSYRGRVYTEGYEQITEACIQRHCFQMGLNCDIKNIDIKEGTDSEFHGLVELNPVNNGMLHVTGPSHPTRRIVDVRFRSVSFENPAGCDALDVLKKRTTWMIDSIRQVE